LLHAVPLSVQRPWGRLCIACKRVAIAFIFQRTSTNLCRSTGCKIAPCLFNYQTKRQENRDFFSFPSVCGAFRGITNLHAAPQHAPNRRRASNDPHNAPPPSTFERLHTPPPFPIGTTRREYERTNEQPNNAPTKAPKKFVENLSRRASNVRQTFVPLRAQTSWRARILRRKLCNVKIKIR